MVQTTAKYGLLRTAGFMRALQEELNEDSQIIEFKEETNGVKSVYAYAHEEIRASWQSILQLHLMINQSCISEANYIL